MAYRRQILRTRKGPAAPRRELEIDDIGEQYGEDLVGFIDDYVKVDELGKPFSLFPHQREILRTAFAFDENHDLAWDTFIYSCVKKSGKTTLNAVITIWWALTQDAPNECYLMANDLEQATSRVYATMAKIIRRNPRLSALAEKVETKLVRFQNATEIKAIASEFTGAAGSNHGLTSWDELWGFTSESSRRLWDEMSPVPTRKNSIRLITTYAGFEGESVLLRELYTAGVGPEEFAEGKAKQIHATLPLYFNPDARLLVYWDHEPRLPWQTAKYYASQRAQLRPSAFTRLHENRWTTSESTFITAEMWDSIVDQALRPLLPCKDVRLYLGVDASVKSDTSAVVGVYRQENRIVVGIHRIWRPTASAEIDLESIEQYLETLHRQYNVALVLADPYQFARSIAVLKAKGVRIEELPQTVSNTTLMGQTMFDLLRNQNLSVYKSSELREQALNAVAIETPRGFRIAKEKASRKIDSLVAMAIACVGAIQAVRPPSQAVVATSTIATNGRVFENGQVVYTPERKVFSPTDHPHTRVEVPTTEADMRQGIAKARSWRAAWSGLSEKDTEAARQAREREARGGDIHIDEFNKTGKPCTYCTLVSQEEARLRCPGIPKPIREARLRGDWSR